METIMVLFISYTVICLLVSTAGRELIGFTRRTTFFVKFLSNIFLTPLFGWIIIRILNLPVVDDSVNEEMMKKIKRMD